MSAQPLVSNVETFLKQASVNYGEVSAEQFDREMFDSIVDFGITSPIEQLFYIAVFGLCASTGAEINPSACDIGDGKSVCGFGIFLDLQARIGKYRVDFVLSQHGNGPEEIYSPVVVELDGHAFHDKDKRQREYEKGRDRFLVKSGYKVLHFTGSEVVSDPYRVAFEALDLIGAFVGTGRVAYDPKNPMGFE